MTNSEKVCYALIAGVSLLRSLSCHEHRRIGRPQTIPNLQLPHNHAFDNLQIQHTQHLPLTTALTDAFGVNASARSKPEVLDKGEDVCLGSTDLAKTFAAQLARPCYRLNHPLIHRFPPQ
ncbi:Uncharacterized protein Rs2_32285 [Raphanus sativus]|nr:Uncharacterized protein Rs2_32285 [Raphanus sativus]